MESVWMEKYRPKTLDEVIGQPQAVSRLRSFASGGSLPHLLLAGPPGSGKTTCALILAKSILGGMTDGNFLELCASDLTKSRPVETTETDEEGNMSSKTVMKKDSSPLWRIREFATTTSIDGIGFRIVFIDEVDTLSKEVQEALRRTMEVYSGNCAFILSCNHPSMIIDPVRSRCNTVRFNPVPRDILSARISEVAELEGVELKDGAANGIAMASHGDIRRAMGILQAAGASGKPVDLDKVFELSSTPASDSAEKMLRDAFSGDFMKARDTLDAMMVDNGMSGREVISEIHSVIMTMGLSDADAVKMLDKIGETDHRIAQCGSGFQSQSLERIQIENLLAYAVMTGRRRRRSLRCSSATGINQRCQSPFMTQVILHTTMGDITLKMNEDMPITTGNFVKLCKEGFYDGTIFHRVIDGFMIQGGDPTGTGMGGPGYNIQDEFGTGHSNRRGTISMANTGRPNSGGSQFFINTVDNTYLDKEDPRTPSAHPVFGEVVSGMDVVDRIGRVETDHRDKPLSDVKIVKAEVLE